MQPLNYFGVTSQQATKHPIGLVKLEMTPGVNAVATQYLQIHDASETPPEDSTPVKSWPLYECGYKEFKRGELRLSRGLYFCISSTQDVKTLTGVTDTMAALQLELDGPDEPSGTSFVGDETTGVAGRTNVWAVGTGPKRIMTVVINDAASVITDVAPYLTIHATSDGGAAMSVARPIVKGQRNVFTFGKDGLLIDKVAMVDGVPVRGTGCNVLLSTAAYGPAFLSVILDQLVPIKVEYK